MYQIEYAEDIALDLAELRAYERTQILDGIDRQLTYEPTQATRNKKILVGLLPPWEHVPPIWELRLGEYRVFYDVDEDNSIVMVRAIRQKPSHQTTQDIL